MTLILYRQPCVKQDLKLHSISRPDTRMRMRPLTPTMMESGKRFVTMLADQERKPKAAFWIYDRDADRWMLLIGHVNGIGDDEAAFNRITNTLLTTRHAELPELEIGDIALALADAPILALLNSLVNTGDEILGINFTNEEINGTVIDGIYLYCMNI